MKRLLTVIFAFALFSSVMAAPSVVDDVGEGFIKKENIVIVSDLMDAPVVAIVIPNSVESDWTIYIESINLEVYDVVNKTYNKYFIFKNTFRKPYKQEDTGQRSGDERIPWHKDKPNNIPIVAEDFRYLHRLQMSI